MHLKVEKLTAGDDPMTPERMVKLVQHFYRMGYMRDLGGGCAVRVPEKNVIYSSPTSIQKEQWKKSDVFVVNAVDGSYIDRPKNPNKVPSATLGLVKETGANCVVHTHSKFAVLLTKLIQGTEFRISEQEMLVGITNRNNGNKYFQYTDILTIPIIEPEPDEIMLGPPLLKALGEYPETSAVLVRGHGVFCFGFDISWQRTKMMLECYEYLFEIACEMIRCKVPLVREPVLQEKRRLSQAA